MNLSPIQVNEFVEHVRGTASDMDAVLLDMFNVGDGLAGLSRETQEEIDSRIFTCNVCNWVCDIDELGPEEDVEHPVCAECAD